MAKESFTDNKRVRDLIKLMTDHSVTELELVEDKARIRLKRDMPTGPVGAGAATVVSAAVPGPAAAGGAEGAAATTQADDLVAIKSPMVGTFYAAPNPDSDPYVRAGASVTPKSVVCVIEAMKVFNEIHAEVAGTVVKMMVANGQAVEFNQPLFMVRPD